MNNYRKYILSAVIAVSFLGIFTSGFFIGRLSIPAQDLVRGVINKEEDKPSQINFSLFWEVWTRIEKAYLKRSQVNRQNLVYGAIAGMVKALEDPYSLFMSPDESNKFLEDMSGSFQGIGAEIGIKNGILTIIAPLEGTPAQKSGLQAGDKILKIDGETTAELSLEEAVMEIRGPKDTEVVLSILRDGFEEIKEISIRRAEIDVPSVKLGTKEELAKSVDLKNWKEEVAYIRLYHFNEDSPEEFKEMAVNLLKSGADKIILDLRNNPGGYLDKVVEIAGWFIPEGEVVAVEDFGNHENKYFRAEGEARLNDFPMVVLIDRGSASASEILAGALREIKGIKLVGERTFGKGSVQELQSLSDGSSLKITVARWLTPLGNSINEEGLAPDIEVEMTQEDYDNNRDPQLEKALEVLKGL